MDKLNKDGLLKILMRDLFLMNSNQQSIGYWLLPHASQLPVPKELYFLFYFKFHWPYSLFSSSKHAPLFSESGLRETGDMYFFYTNSRDNQTLSYISA